MKAAAIGHACSASAFPDLFCDERHGTPPSLAGPKPYDAPAVDVAADRATNRIFVKRCGSWLRLLLHAAGGRLLSSGKPVSVIISEHGGRPSASFDGIVSQPSDEIKSRTVMERGDPAFCFDSQITIAFDASSKQWQLQ